MKTLVILLMLLAVPASAQETELPEPWNVASGPELNREQATDLLSQLALGEQITIEQERRMILDGTLEVPPNLVLRDLRIDAKKLGPDQPALKFVGKHAMDSYATLDNVRIYCKGNVGIEMKSSKGNQIAFSRINATIFNASIGVLMDSTDGGWVNGNQIDLIGYNCGRFVEMRSPSASGGSMTGNRIIGQFQPGKSTELGISCEGRNNVFDVLGWDWQKVNGPLIHFLPATRRNEVRQQSQVIYGPRLVKDEGKFNVIPKGQK